MHFQKKKKNTPSSKQTIGNNKKSDGHWTKNRDHEIEKHLSKQIARAAHISGTKSNEEKRNVKIWFTVVDTSVETVYVLFGGMTTRDIFSFQNNSESAASSVFFLSFLLTHIQILMQRMFAIEMSIFHRKSVREKNNKHFWHISVALALSSSVWMCGCHPSLLCRALSGVRSSVHHESKWSFSFLRRRHLMKTILGVGYNLMPPHAHTHTTIQSSASINNFCVAIFSSSSYFKDGHVLTLYNKSVQSNQNNVCTKYCANFPSSSFLVFWEKEEQRKWCV